MGFTQIIKKQLFATILSDDALNPIYLIFIHFGSKKKQKKHYWQRPIFNGYII